MQVVVMAGLCVCVMYRIRPFSARSFQTNTSCSPTVMIDVAIRLTVDRNSDRSRLLAVPGWLVQFKMVSMRSEKPIGAPPRLSEVSPAFSWLCFRWPIREAVSSSSDSKVGL